MWFINTDKKNRENSSVLCQWWKQGGSLAWKYQCIDSDASNSQNHVQENTPIMLANWLVIIRTMNRFFLKELKKCLWFIPNITKCSSWSGVTLDFTVFLTAPLSHLEQRSCITLHPALQSLGFPLTTLSFKIGYLV